MPAMSNNRIELVVKMVMGISNSISDIGKESLDNQIDQLVYQLYGLTEEEIGVVEEI